MHLHHAGKFSLKRFDKWFIIFEKLLQPVFSTLYRFKHLRLGCFTVKDAQIQFANSIQSPGSAGFVCQRPGLAFENICRLVLSHILHILVVALRKCTGHVKSANGDLYK